MSKKWRQTAPILPVFDTRIPASMFWSMSICLSANWSTTAFAIAWCVHVYEQPWFKGYALELGIGVLTEHSADEYTSGIYNAEISRQTLLYIS